jgi:hypothetical protein
LKRFGHQAPAEALHAALPRASATAWVELEPSQPLDPLFSTAPTEKNERWRVIVRRPSERDE